MTRNRNLKFRNMDESTESAPHFRKKHSFDIFQLISWVVVEKHVWPEKWPKHVPELSIS